MRTYWDSSALLDAILEIQNARNAFDRAPHKLTRSHALAETFSLLTGGRLGWRMLPAEAARKIADLASHMTVVSLSPSQTLDALHQTQARGVRGGAIHDFLHAYAAELNDCRKIVTGNISDFAPITDLEVTLP